MLLASRTYYSGLNNLQPDTIQVWFEGVPLPGYGWVFPISSTAANVGVIFHPRTRNNSTSSQPDSNRSAFAAFLQTPALKKQLHGAERTAPLKGFPVNTNFGSYSTVATRFLLVGEAAGLVNPLTADGTDFALSSGKLAAAHILRAFASNDFSRQNLQAYDADLRQRYNTLFTSCRWARDWLNNPTLFNQMLRGAAFAPAFNRVLMNVLLG
jgi:flavin-dependent dehydrogenase